MSLVTPIFVSHKDDQAQVGTIISEHLLAVPELVKNEAGELVPSGHLRYQATLGVCWDSQRTPAIAYHQPEDLVWLAIPALEDEEDDDDNEEDEEPEHGVEEIQTSEQDSQHA